MPDEPAVGPPEETKPEPKAPPARVVIRPLPKIVFLYPTALASLVCFLGQGLGGSQHTWGLVFFITLALNLPVVAFDFSRVTFVVLVLVVVLFAVLQWLTPLFSFIGGLEIGATQQFYGWFCILMAVIYLIVFIQTRFNYWELTHNELLHHHGVLGDVERYPAPGLRITKEVNDVFEFILLGAGRLVIQPPVEPRAIILHSIVRVNHVENRMKALLATLQVKVRSTN